ncbi:hypothetical protein GQ53DRAFT_596485, partial [Thozetella sp. PMI_491]
ASMNPFSFCKDDQCGDCPVSVTSAGTGFPNCVTYNSDDVFKNQGFPGAAGGGYEPWIDIAQPDQGCQIIVKSPAHTTLPGCGYTIGSFEQAVCAVLDIEKSFMVQYCCGIDQCKDAGVPVKRFSRLSAASRNTRAESGGMYSLLIRDVNGSVIEPTEVGHPPGMSGRDKIRPFQPHSARSASSSSLLVKRGCEAGSWVPEGDDYTRPADKTTIVFTGIGSEQEVTIDHSRSQTWTTTIGAEFGFEDVI